MRLLVDLGNSRLKWACSEPGWHVGSAMLRGDITDVLDDVWQALPTPSRVVMASVAPDVTNETLERWVHDRWRVRVHRAKSQAELLGVVNRYVDPTALGADRWVALIGARAELPGSAACVVDCGTAVTIDALTADGVFIGGVIFPGLELLRRALTVGTAHVRVADGDEMSCLARSTGDAVAAGTLYGLTGAIERVCYEFEEALTQTVKLIITGGDADRIAAHLTRPARRVPDLVLKGLDRLAATL